MKNIRSLMLIISAVFVTKVLITALLILLSTPSALAELSASETELRVTYEILMAYYLVVTVLLLFTSVSLFNQATKRNSFQLNFALTSISLLMSGAHLAVAIIGNSESLLAQSAQSSIWVPALVCFATLTTFLIAKTSNRPGTDHE